MNQDDGTLEWLLAGDPAIRWQVQQDLLGSSPHEVATTRQLVAAEGWGARLLAKQDADGRWAGGLYSPKWTSTTYTLLLLHWLGLPRGHQQALTGCAMLWDGATFYGGGLTLAKSVHQPETCITAMLVLVASSFGYPDERLAPAVGWLLGQQLPDGGWNCESVRSGSRHGSFHTSISALDALLQYHRAAGDVPVRDAIGRGQEFFLAHRLYRSHRSGAVVHPGLLRFPFPPQWHFDVLRGLDHFRAAEAGSDPRMTDALRVIRDARQRDGRWPVYRSYPGRTWFRMEPPGPSRWTTLRALRVLAWAEPGQANTSGIGTRWVGGSDSGADVLQQVADGVIG